MSKQKFLHECAQRQGVSTQWFKDLGYKVVQHGPDWTLVPPIVPEALRLKAAQALGHIMAAARVVEVDPNPHVYGGGEMRIDIPGDSALWIAKVAQEWALEEEVRIRDILEEGSAEVDRREALGDAARREVEERDA